MTSVTQFKDLSADSLELTKFDSLTKLANPATEYPDKKSQPLISLCRFGNKRTEKGSLRHDDNVIAINGVVGDYDGSELTITDAYTRLVAEHGLHCALLTTATPGRWRVIVPTSKELPPSEHKRLTGVLNAMLKGVLAPESFKLSQGYYFGRVAGVPFESYPHEKGQFIDEISWVEPVYPTGTAANDGNHNYVVSDTATPEQIDHLKSALDYIRFKGDCGYVTWTNLGQNLKSLGDVGRELWLEWSKLSPKYDGEAECLRKWKGFNGTKSDFKAVFQKAYSLGWEAPKPHLDLSHLPWGEGEYHELTELSWQEFLKKTIANMNDKFAVVYHNEDLRVMEFEYDSMVNRKYLTYHKPKAFIDFQAKEKIKVDEKDGKDVIKPLGQVWFNHPDRRTYQRVVFAPGRQVSPEYFNSWCGFAVEPACANVESTQLIYKHILDVLAQGDIKLYRYIMNWIAWGFQNPGDPIGTCLIFRGSEGVGKSLIGNFLARLYGEHGRSITQGSQLTGKFNGHLTTTCFLFADEAFFAGDKHGAESLKTLVTEPTISVEKKGVDVGRQVPNCLKVMMATNQDHVLPTTHDPRRWVVLDAGNVHKGDRAYFKALHAALNDPIAQAAFLYDMLNNPLGDWSPLNIPMTKALEEQKIYSLPSHGEWLRHCLTEGHFNIPGRAEWSDSIRSSELYTSYLTFCKTRNLTTYDIKSNVVVSKYLNEMFTKSRKALGWTYDLGTHEQAMGAFTKHHKLSFDALDW